MGCSFLGSRWVPSQNCPFTNRLSIAVSVGVSAVRLPGILENAAIFEPEPDSRLAMFLRVDRCHVLRREGKIRSRYASGDGVAFGPLHGKAYTVEIGERLVGFPGRCALLREFLHHHLAALIEL